MPAPFRRQVDEGILDRAAALLAQQGVAKTSVQDVADAVGLSKAGLLHHFPSKDALHQAVADHAVALGADVLEAVRPLPLDAERDRRSVELVVEVALAHPGMVALMLSPAGAELDGDGTVGDAVLAAFGVDASDVAPGTGEPSERTLRVIGALGALAVLTMAAHRHDRAAAWRARIVTTCLDALGHPRATTPTPEV